MEGIASNRAIVFVNDLNDRVARRLRHTHVGGGPQISTTITTTYNYYFTMDPLIEKRLPSTLICFSHLRWDFVFQRPQHLMTRFARFSEVYFFEEPIVDAMETAYLSYEKKSPNLWVCTPHLPTSLNPSQVDEVLTSLLRVFFEKKREEDFLFWYYTPMALRFSACFTPGFIVYDCMDELAAFKFAPNGIRSEEQKLFERADIVFTGGRSLYEAKQNDHPNIHSFPSSIDKTHFESARINRTEPDCQTSIPEPRIGFYGVIDERFDLNLLQEIAEKRPAWQLVLIGPIAKIDPAVLPKHSNIHYLGQQRYEDLPAFLSGWSVALIPFALNESTQFISPTKTPEYLAAGKPVVSTPIRDVVFPYAAQRLVRIGKTPDAFIDAIEASLPMASDPKWLAEVDRFLQNDSWENTFANMRTKIIETLSKKWGSSETIRAQNVLTQ